MVYCAWRGWPIRFVASVAAAYFWDCVDGQFARRYDDVSEFGDWYDHVTDLATGITVCVILWTRYTLRPLHFVLAVVFAVAINVATACAQRNSVRHDEETLDIFQPLCVEQGAVTNGVLVWTSRVLFGRATLDTTRGRASVRRSTVSGTVVVLGTLFAAHVLIQSPSGRGNQRQ